MIRMKSGEPGNRMSGSLRGLLNITGRRQLKLMRGTGELHTR